MSLARAAPVLPQPAQQPLTHLTRLACSPRHAVVGLILPASPSSPPHLLSSPAPPSPSPTTTSPPRSCPLPALGLRLSLLGPLNTPSQTPSLSAIHCARAPTTPNRPPTPIPHASCRQVCARPHWAFATNSALVTETRPRALTRTRTQSALEVQPVRRYTRNRPRNGLNSVWKLRGTIPPRVALLPGPHD